MAEEHQKPTAPILLRNPLVALLDKRPFGPVPLAFVTWYVALTFVSRFLPSIPSFWHFANSCQTVEVPGGQQIYVAPNGAVGYTQAHSGVAPPGSQFEGFAVENGELSFATSGFYACVSADNSTYPQLYASALMSNFDNCYSIKLATATGNEPGFAAWQYT